MKKVYIGLILFFVVLGIVMFLLFGLDSLKREKYTTTLVVGDNTTWIYQKKAWKRVNSNSIYDELSWKKYQVFENNEKLGTYNLWHSDKWYVFDDEKNAVNLNGEMFAYKSDFDIKLDRFSKDETEIDNYISTVLEDKGLPSDSEFTKSYKTDVDIDHDGVEETFYVISNVFSLNFTPKRLFSIVFMVKDDKIYYLYDDVRDYLAYSGCSPEIVSFVDVDGEVEEDNTDEVIISCYQYSNLGRIDMMYYFNGERFKMLISN